MKKIIRILIIPIPILIKGILFKLYIFHKSDTLSSVNSDVEIDIEIKEKQLLSISDYEMLENNIDHTKILLQISNILNNDIIDIDKSQFIIDFNNLKNHIFKRLSIKKSDLNADCDFDMGNDEYFINKMSSSTLMGLNHPFNLEDQNSENSEYSDSDEEDSDDGIANSNNMLNKRYDAISRILNLQDAMPTKSMKKLEKQILNMANESDRGRRFLPIDIDENELLSNTKGLGGRKLTKAEKLQLKKEKRDSRRGINRSNFKNGDYELIRSDVLQKLILQKTYGVPANLLNQQLEIARKPIEEDNIGHKMLKKLGWDGGGLGANKQGIVEPIAVTIKNNKTGIGLH